jgi:hypothetical protein
MRWALTSLIVFLALGQLQGQQPERRNTRTDKTLLAADPAPNQPLLDKFKKLMTGAKLTGMFTLDGRPMDKLNAETYEIEKVEKMPEGDQWAITARIKYGDKDAVFPVPVEVKWAGTTPVITLDNVVIPGLGTFSARVLLHGDRYAGTWQHDDKGGHMFGKIDLPK